MICPHCKKETKLDKKKRLITRESFEKLQKGSILISVLGRKREVLHKGENGYIRLRKVSWKGLHQGDYTGYLYSDICFKYRVLKY